MGNGAKAQQKRERAAKDKNTAKSQLKVNEKACDIQCQICRSTFLKTTKAPAPTDTPFFFSLKEHAENKHSKTIEECFPMFQQ
ncbi:zinc-binding domain-containing protein [Fusarium heterosporum]|uniref:Zinc-binding domain-containing protein n=1 Tax=Fusarium heterosporum TaxID=42747 RepID=A0A8H5T4X5_FUSHE|nr:zinc-binding domain-containing protein [Fusarium heterosporum]